MIFADVIVDISVKSLDRPFQYIVPEEMKKLWKNSQKKIISFFVL